MINLQYVVCKKFKIENNEIGIKDNVFIINVWIIMININLCFFLFKFLKIILEV